ncbi:MAG: hypothetical protein AB1817_20060 [Chloroflexota bacterium]
MDMKLNHNREDDILIIETEPAGKVDHAEQTGSVIAPFDTGNQLVFLEVLDAGEFISSLAQVALRGEGRQLPLAATR